MEQKKSFSLQEQIELLIISFLDKLKANNPVVYALVNGGMQLVSVLLVLLLSRGTIDEGFIPNLILWVFSVTLGGTAALRAPKTWEVLNDFSLDRTIKGWIAKMLDKVKMNNPTIFAVVQGLLQILNLTLISLVNNGTVKVGFIPDFILWIIGAALSGFIAMAGTRTYKRLQALKGKKKKLADVKKAA